MFFIKWSELVRPISHKKDRSDLTGAIQGIERLKLFFTDYCIYQPKTGITQQ